MTQVNFEIEKYQEVYKTQILRVWEKAVLATHDFLQPQDFQEIKIFLEQFDFNSLEVYCLMQGQVVIGFIAVDGKKVEMLFIDSDYFGIGLGKSLLDFAITVLEADRVDVNEQNTDAVGFYKKMGFIVYERTDKDDQGRAYPLLRMKLSTSS
ncbi:GNAT family N-acetyltransferase [Flavobacterium sp. NKUCC04_CG]|uniref:GNAT family N-acetyltransferase n=1 Tax=Flavobacterium sp. NKUCC04_CG TaxID=2842121 RepID=UPI001C5ADCCC|nr:GNAT family N-acetyltransferase [Flavobacterium sp. NKUCC04_CG]MBW3519960.1 GNAT family N-acetyltransferase [Flavobacterium sp. NKUCC04_CG]